MATVTNRDDVFTQAFGGALTQGAAVAAEYGISPFDRILIDGQPAATRFTPPPGSTPEQADTYMRTQCEQALLSGDHKIKVAELARTADGEHVKVSLNPLEADISAVEDKNDRKRTGSFFQRLFSRGKTPQERLKENQRRADTAAEEAQENDARLAIGQKVFIAHDEKNIDRVAAIGREERARASAMVAEACKSGLANEERHCLPQNDPDVQRRFTRYETTARVRTLNRPPSRESFARAILIADGESLDDVCFNKSPEFQQKREAAGQRLDAILAKGYPECRDELCDVFFKAGSKLASEPVPDIDWHNPADIAEKFPRLDQRANIMMDLNQGIGGDWVNELRAYYDEHKLNEQPGYGNDYDQFAQAIMFFPNVVNPGKAYVSACASSAYVEGRMPRRGEVPDDRLENEQRHTGTTAMNILAASQALDTHWSEVVGKTPLELDNMSVGMRMTMAQNEFVDAHMRQFVDYAPDLDYSVFRAFQETGVCQKAAPSERQADANRRETSLGDLAHDVGARVQAPPRVRETAETRQQSNTEEHSEYVSRSSRR